MAACTIIVLAQGAKMAKRLTAEVAVIDIGSNSVRLVMYDVLKHSPIPLFNEKILCGLAQDMDKTKCLYPEGVVCAKRALGRFVRLLDNAGVKKRYVFATAAVRDAKDGKDFVRSIKQEFGLKIDVLSGEDESLYAAHGVMSAIPNAEGVVGDLGGGSMEFGTVANNTVGDFVSLPIGPLRLGDAYETVVEYTDFIDRHLKHFPLARYLRGKQFYAVGGAFRNLAKIHMDRKGYPLRVVQHYAVSAHEFMSTLEVVSRMSKKALQKLSYVSRKRLEFLPYAALLMQRIVELGKPEEIVFCSSGLREGVLFSHLRDEIKQQDPLLEGAKAMMAQIGRSAEYGLELSQWMAPILDGEIDLRLRDAACILSDISIYEHTEYRAELAYRRILDSSLVGINHKERVFIAKALFFRYNSRLQDDMIVTVESLLTVQEMEMARIMGLAMRLARYLTASISGLLLSMPLKIKKDKLLLVLKGDNQILHGEIIERALTDLSDELGLKPVLSF